MDEVNPWETYGKDEERETDGEKKDESEREESEHVVKVKQLILLPW